MVTCFRFKNTFQLNPLFHHSNRLFTTDGTKFHKFETLVRERTIASIHPKDPVLGLVKELKEFVSEFNAHDDKDEFFTRKSHKNVLSVIQCERNGQFLYFRGRNIEVSLPSGTICAERSAITNAVSNNLSLHRKHFKRIAVIDPACKIIGIEPCGVCREYLQKLQAQSPEFSIITFPDDEFKSIYEHFPADYPVEDVDAEQTQKALDRLWQCSCCDEGNSGYSTNCYLCGVSKAATAKKRLYKLFEDRALVLNMVETILENFPDEQQFTFQDLKEKMKVTHADDLKTINSLLFHLASKSRAILRRQDPSDSETWPSLPRDFGCFPLTSVAFQANAELLEKYGKLIAKHNQLIH